MNNSSNHIPLDCTLRNTSEPLRIGTIATLPELLRIQIVLASKVVHSRPRHLSDLLALTESCSARNPVLVPHV